MAWECKNCGTPVDRDDQSKCPDCGAAKMSWTMVADQTRTFTVSGSSRKLTVLRGVDSEPGPWDASYEQVEVVETDHAVAIPKQAALRLSQQELLPAPEQVLFVRLFPGTTEDLTVKLTMLYETDEPGASEAPGTLAESTVEELGHHDVRFLFVYGTEELPEGFSFPGVHVVEITEDTEEGFAPTVGVAALGKKRQDLPIEAFSHTVDRLTCAKLNFHTDSGLVMPDGLAIIRAALDHARENPDRHLLIAGHTDKHASDAYNLELSRARAKAVLDVVVGDEEGWLEDVARKNSHLHEDTRTVLAQVSELWDWDCHPGSTGNDPLDAAAKTAIGRFKKRFNRKFTTEHLDPSDVVEAADDAFWKRVFSVYAHELAERLELTAADYDALVDSVNWVDDEHRGVGYGEAHPLGDDDAANRRIEFLYLDPGALPDRPNDDEQGAYLETLYDPTEYSFDSLDCPEPDFYGPVPHNVVFVIDTSGSMRPQAAKDGQPARADRIGVAKRNLNRAILDLPQGHRFAVLAFSNDLKLLWERDGAPLLKVADDATKSEASKWVNALGAHGSTRSSLALSTALEAQGADDTQPMGIKFLSDGSPSPRDMPQPGTRAFDAWSRGKTARDHNALRRKEEQDILADVAANRGAWKIDTIGFFKDAQEQGPLVTFMQNLAEQNEGEFTHVAVNAKPKVKQ